MYLQLPTGNTIIISTYEWLFKIPESEVHLFIQACVADNLGEYIDNPFSARAPIGKLEMDEFDHLLDEGDSSPLEE